ncbi:DUF898 family protein [Aestuariirhabdus sp. LZHN29]|uniref:YjgN family protein n=1 Tax=Aestuariirhabdus sp. LZHN29 TaxID=3417462 RepID=UPI003CEAE64A
MQDSAQYDAVFHGKLLDGVDPERAREQFSTLFKMKPQAVDSLFERVPVVIKKGLDKTQAKQLQAKMARAGYQVAFRKIEPAPALEPEPRVEPAPSQVGGSWSLEPIAGEVEQDPAQTGDNNSDEDCADSTAPGLVDAVPATRQEAKESGLPDENGGQVWGKAQPRVKAAPRLKADDTGTTEAQGASSEPHQGKKEVPAPSASGQSRFVDVEFLGDGKEYFRIWIVNVLLSIVTLGIYSAWAKVRNNQYFYGHTQIEGSSFEYLANPIAILKGRLIAFAVFVIFVLAQRWNPLIGSLLSLLLVPLVPWIVIRSLAFHARNSAWRNIRFNFQASWFEALKAFILWPLAGSFTLGLLMPYALHKQKHFLLNNSSFGATKFVFEGGAGIWYRFFLRVLGAVFVATVLSFLLSGVLSIILYSLLYIGLYAAYKTFEGNLVFNMSHLSTTGFHSELEAKKIAWIYVTNTLGIVLTLGLYIPWAKVRMAHYRAESLQLEVVDSLDKFVADEQEKVTALGGEMDEMFDMEISVI